MVTRSFVATLLLVVVVAPPASAQLIQVKTVPLAQADQFQVFPSQAAGMGGVSIALSDTLYDASVNPAKGARLTGGRMFGSPFLYSVSNQAGGGRTLPLGVMTRAGSWFGGLTLALQQIDTPRGGAFTPPVFGASGAMISQPQLLTDRSSGNAMAFATLGRALGAGGLSLAGSFGWARLHAVDGVDFLYAGSNAVAQSGYTWDARVGLLQQWPGGRSAEILLLRDAYHMTHHVSFLDQLWSPVTQQMVPRTRLEDNLDQTDTWGVHVAYQQPLGASGWRIGGLATANRLLHPEIPTYDMTPVGVQWIPWDPGDSWAYNLGMGVATTTPDGATLGLDVIFEPIWTHTWGEAHDPTPTVSGDTIPIGGKTVDNYFAFTNAWLRLGVGQDIVLGKTQPVGAGFQLGLVLHAVDYTLNQYDAIQQVGRSQPEDWLEWAPTWGLTLRLPGMELRYQGRVSNGTGRPGVVPTGRFGVDTPTLASAGSIVAAPSGPLTLGAVSIVTHQISFSFPLSRPTTAGRPR
jgi:hypothetical protein